MGTVSQGKSSTQTKERRLSTNAEFGGSPGVVAGFPGEDGDVSLRGMMSLAGNRKTLGVLEDSRGTVRATPQDEQHGRSSGFMEDPWLSTRHPIFKALLLSSLVFMTGHGFQHSNPVHAGRTSSPVTEPLSLGP